MKQSSPTNHSFLFILLPAFFFIFVASCNNTETPKEEKPADTASKTTNIIQPLTESQNIFRNMATSVADLKRVAQQNQGFKRIIFQFNNDGYNAPQDGFVYSVMAYALKNNDYFDSTFLKPSKGSVPLAAPFRLANLEWRTRDIRNYFDLLSSNNTPIESFDSVRFKPFIDRDYGKPIVNLQIIPFRTGSIADSAALLLPSTKSNPCPPAKQQ